MEDGRWKMKGGGLGTARPTCGSDHRWILTGTVGGGRRRGLIGAESVEFGLGDVAAEDVEKIVAQIASEDLIADAEIPGFDAVGAQLLGEPEVGGWFAAGGFVPGAGAETGEAREEGLSGHAIHFLEGENDENVQEERGDGIALLGASPQADGGLAGQFGPLTAGEVGESEQRLPDVGGAVVEGGRYLVAGRGDFGGVIRDEPKALLFEGGGVQFPGAVTLFLGGFALHADDDAKVGEGVRESANLGQDLCIV